MNNGLYRILSKIIEFFNLKKKSPKQFLFLVFPGVFSVVWSCRDRVPGDSGPENIEQIFWTKECFFLSEKAIGPARAGWAGKKKIEKFRLYELLARQPASGTGPG